MKLKLDLHELYSDSQGLDRALSDIMRQAQEKKAKTVEIIPGKGSGALKRRVLKFLEENYRGVFHRIEKDDKNWGRIFVHFRW